MIPDRISHSKKKKERETPNQRTMLDTEPIAYHNRRQMEETTARVYARLHQMKSALCRKLKRKMTTRIAFHQRETRLL
jgi:hypothetical protein